MIIQIDKSQNNYYLTQKEGNSSSEAYGRRSSCQDNKRPWYDNSYENNSTDDIKVKQNTFGNSMKQFINKYLVCSSQAKYQDNAQKNEGKEQSPRASSSCLPLRYFTRRLSQQSRNSDQSSQSSNNILTKPSKSFLSTTPYAPASKKVDTRRIHSFLPDIKL